MSEKTNITANQYSIKWHAIQELRSEIGRTTLQKEAAIEAALKHFNEEYNVLTWRFKIRDVYSGSHNGLIKAFASSPRLWGQKYDTPISVNVPISISPILAKLCIGNVCVATGKPRIDVRNGEEWSYEENGNVPRTYYDIVLDASTVELL